jgi:hypothetical protein
MADDKPVDASATWLPVIGKALAYLCLQEAHRKEPNRFDTVLKQVKFLQGLGLSRNDAAEAAGSSADSVRVMHSRRESTKVKNAITQKKAGRRR